MSKTISLFGSISAEIRRNVQGKQFAGIDEFLAEAEAAGIFKDEFNELAAQWAKKELIRRVLREKDQGGFPLFPNLVITDQTGKKKRVYMRERFMRPPHYQQVAKYWEGCEKHAQWMANECIERCNQRYNTQLALPFPDPDAHAA